MNLEGLAQPQALRERSRALFDRWEAFAATPAASRLMFLWAFAESIFWPVSANFLLAPLVMGSRSRFYVPLIASILGSAFGGSLVLLFSWLSPQQAIDLVTVLPFVPDRHLQVAELGLMASGSNAFFIQPWSGVPFRIWALLSGPVGVNVWLAIPVSILGRSFRMCVDAIACRIVVAAYPAFVRDYSIILAGAYALWCLILLFSFLR